MNRASLELQRILRSNRIRGLVLAILMALSIAAPLMLTPGLTHAQARLDQEEREELRRALRRQALEDRGRDDSPERAARDRGRQREARGDRHRMAPEEREQLRRMLREHHRRRGD